MFYGDISSNIRLYNNQITDQQIKKLLKQYRLILLSKRCLVSIMLKWSKADQNLAKAKDS